MYYEQFHDEYNNCEIDIPIRTSFMDLSDEQLKDIPIEEQVRLLKKEVNVLSNSLSRCIHILNAFQNTYTDYLNYMDSKIQRTASRIEQHMDCYHTMLIISNKEIKKDESNIP